MHGKKTGGRRKGTPNKTTAAAKQFISELLDNYSGRKACSDFAKLTPNQRLLLVTELLKYVLPKRQSVAMELEADGEIRTIETRLLELSKLQEDE